MDISEAYHQVNLLRQNLSKIVERDPEQEVRSIAIPVLDAVLAEAKSVLPADHPVIRQIRDVVSPEVVESDEPLRAVDLLHVVTALYAALAGPYADWVNSKIA
jgi:hypothetical protein